MTDDGVKSMIEEGMMDVRNVRSLSQLFLSVMESRGDIDLSELIGTEMSRPEVLQAFEIAKAFSVKQGFQSIILRRTESKPGPLARRIRIGKA